jgi:HK97 gp10 family phage protein
MIGAELDITRALSKLDSFTKKVSVGVRPATQAGTQVFYNEVAQRLSKLGAPGQYSAPGQAPLSQSGDLKLSIYQFYVKEESSDTRATFLISWRKKDAFYGRMLENGTSKMAARPFLRPSFDAKQVAAIQAVRSRLTQLVQDAQT